MNRKDLQELMSHKAYPSVSILFPTHRTFPENRQDGIRLSNLIKELINRLQMEFTKREYQPLIEKLNKLTFEHNHSYNLDSLALFISRDYSAKFLLPFPVKEQVVIDDTFLTRDILFTINRSPRYYVLALSEKPTRLFEGFHKDISEIKNENFPMIHEGPGGSAPLPGEMGLNKSAYRDEHHKKFFRSVDRAFMEIYNNDKLPLVLLGVERYLSFYNEICTNKNIIISEIKGSYDKANEHEISELVWPAVYANIKKQRLELLKKLENAVSAQKSTSGIEEVWRFAAQGRCDTVLVEENFHFPAVLSPDNRGLIKAQDPKAPGVMDDAVDNLIETVLQKGGSVYFMDDGSLSDYQKIAGILRY